MKTHEIKRVIDYGGNVYWKNKGYHVIQDGDGDYMIKCTMNNNYIGLTHEDGFTLNGEESDFYWLENRNEKHHGSPFRFAGEMLCKFFEMLDECWEPMNIGYSTFTPSDVIKTDRVFFHEAFFEYVDSIEKDENITYPDFLYSYWIDEVYRLSYK